MGMFVYVNENGATGIILADDITGAASVVGEFCNSDVVMKELDNDDYYEDVCHYSLSSYNFCEWPWLVTREIGTDYEYKLCKRQNAWGTPWGAVDIDVSVTPYGKE